MNSRDKLKRICEILKDQGLSRSDIFPWPHQLLWKIGIQVKPPLFSSFFSNVVIMGVFFMVLYRIFRLCLYFFSDNRENLASAVISTLIFGVSAGTAISFIYYIKAQKLNLPDWDNYEEDNDKQELSKKPTD